MQEGYVSMYEYLIYAKQIERAPAKNIFNIYHSRCTHHKGHQFYSRKNHILKFYSNSFLTGKKTVYVVDQTKTKRNSKGTRGK
jgi:hypothetical protein